MTLWDTHSSQKLLGLITTKALMIKINVITNNNNWYRIIKNPVNYVARKIDKINRSENLFFKKKIYCTLLLSDNKEIKNLNKKLVFDYESGIRLNILTDYFELYLPVYSSLGNELSQSDYLSKIRFRVSFDPRTLSSLISRRWF